MASIIRYTFLHGRTPHAITFDGISLPVEALREAISQDSGFAAVGAPIALYGQDGKELQSGSVIPKNSDVMVKIRPPQPRRETGGVRGVGGSAVSTTARKEANALMAANLVASVDKIGNAAVRGGKGEVAATVYGKGKTAADMFGISIDRSGGGTSGQIKTHARFMAPVSAPTGAIAARDGARAVEPRRDDFRQRAARMLGSTQASSVAASSTTAVEQAVGTDDNDEDMSSRGDEREVVPTRSGVSLGTSTGPDAGAGAFAATPAPPPWKPIPVPEIDVDVFAPDSSENCLALLDRNYRFDLPPVPAATPISSVARQTLNPHRASGMPPRPAARPWMQQQQQQQYQQYQMPPTAPQVWPSQQPPPFGMGGFATSPLTGPAYGMPPPPRYSHPGSYPPRPGQAYPSLPPQFPYPPQQHLPPANTQLRRHQQELPVDGAARKQAPPGSRRENEDAHPTVRVEDGRLRVGDDRCAPPHRSGDGEIRDLDTLERDGRWSAHVPPPAHSTLPPPAMQARIEAHTAWQASGGKGSGGSGGSGARYTSASREAAERDDLYLGHHDRRDSEGLPRRHEAHVGYPPEIRDERGWKRPQGGRGAFLPPPHYRERGLEIVSDVRAPQAAVRVDGGRDGDGDGDGDVGHLSKHALLRDVREVAVAPTTTSDPTSASGRAVSEVRSRGSKREDERARGRDSGRAFTRERYEEPTGSSPEGRGEQHRNGSSRQASTGKHKSDDAVSPVARTGGSDTRHAVAFARGEHTASGKQAATHREESAASGSDTGARDERRERKERDGGHSSGARGNRDGTSSRNEVKRSGDEAKRSGERRKHTPTPSWGDALVPDKSSANERHSATHEVNAISSRSLAGSKRHRERSRDEIVKDSVHSSSLRGSGSRSEGAASKSARTSASTNAATVMPVAAPTPASRAVGSTGSRDADTSEHAPVLSSRKRRELEEAASRSAYRARDTTRDAHATTTASSKSSSSRHHRESKHRTDTSHDASSDRWQME